MLVENFIVQYNYKNSDKIYVNKHKLHSFMVH